MAFAVRDERLWLAGVALVCAGACGDGSMAPWEVAGNVHEDAERWQPVDSPHSMGMTLELHLSRLPLRGAAAQQPWPGSHWPTYKDSINDRWFRGDTASPVEKYMRAYGGKRLDDIVSRQHGIAYAGGPGCKSDAGCNDGYACARRRGQPAGHCVSTWWGICDGWAAASVLTPEPTHPVIARGVRFEVNDIKALLSYAYLSSPSYVAGGRCNDFEVAFDTHHRPLHASCRDSNAGSFHLILTNVVGLGERNIIIDHDLGPRVFNYPVLDFEVQSMTTINGARMRELLGLKPGRTYNTSATQWRHVYTDVRYVKDPDSSVDGPQMGRLHDHLDVMHLEYILELDNTGRIVGGEWLGDSRENHPDFTWRPVRAHSSAYPFVWQHVRELAKVSSDTNL